MVAGSALIVTPEPTMLTKVGGAILVVHGADNVSAGLEQIFSGEQTQTRTQAIVKSSAKALGASEQTADMIATGVDMAIGIGGMAGAMAKTAPKALAPAAKAAGSGQVANQTAKVVSNYTKSNFRSNLIKLTGANPGKTAQAHHVFPQKFEAIFSKMGINIHDPKFGAWWDTTSHLKNASSYNEAWTQFFRTNPTRSQVFEKGRELMKEYGISLNF